MALDAIPKYDMRPTSADHIPGSIKRTSHRDPPRSQSPVARTRPLVDYAGMGDPMNRESVACAVNNVHWYDAIFRSHGLSGAIADGM
jgi:hypothetical protein